MDPNNGDSMQTPNVFVEYTGRLIGISASILPKMEKMHKNNISQCYSVRGANAASSS